MKKIALVSFLIIFTFILNEVFVFGQRPGLVRIRDKANPEVVNLVSNVEGVNDPVDGNEVVIKPLERDVLLDFKIQLEYNSNSDIEDRIETIVNVLEKSSDMFCTADEDRLNDSGDELNLQLNGMMDKYGAINKAPKNERDELSAKEMNLRHDIIKTIDSVLKNSGRCNNVPPRDDLQI